MVGALPPKEDFARALLLRGVVFLHLDPRTEGVKVPPWLSQQAQLVLSIGLDLPIPIPDLRVDAEGVFGTLSFGGSPYGCTVPWEAVFAVVGDDNMGMVWPEDIPLEITAEMERSRRPRLQALSGDGGRSDEADERRPALRAVPGGAADEQPVVPASPGEAQAAAADGSSEAPSKPRPPHLRLVK